MSIILEAHQQQISVQCADKLNQYGICYLSMQVRTGKTLTALSACTLVNAKNVLFVTKKKAMPDITKQYKELSPSYNCDIINYESLQKLSHNQYDVVICDESHCIGAFPKLSLRAKTLKDLIKKWNEPKIIYLSGTPTPESYSQLYAQLAITKKSPFKEYSSFYKWAVDFVTVKKKYVAHGNPINDYSFANEQLIKERTKHLFINYSQQEAGIKETISEEVLYVQMKDVTYDLCKRLIKDLVVEGNSKTILADTAVKLQNKLHQLYSGTIIFEDGTNQVIDPSKVEFIAEYFKGKKIAIFYKFRAELDAIKSIFPNITDNDLEFNASDNLTYTGQIQSSREGTNLSSADYLVFMNVDFAAISYFQARDRMTNKWRVKENKIFWIFAKDGIEEKIFKAVGKKKDYTLSYFKRDYKLDL